LLRIRDFAAKEPTSISCSHLIFATIFFFVCSVAHSVLPEFMSAVLSKGKREIGNLESNACLPDSGLQSVTEMATFEAADPAWTD
jgi:hypothetical protein